MNQKKPPLCFNWTRYEINLLWFPCVLWNLYKKLKLFTIKEAVQKVVLPIKRWRVLKDRGNLIPRAFADIVLLDLPKIHVQENDVEPRLYPEGIEYVFVNGKIVIEARKHTGEKPGKILKRIT